MIYFNGVKPHANTEKHRLETFNEVMVMFINYQTILFSKMNLNVDMKHKAGYGYILTMGLVLVVNIYIMIKNTYAKAKRKRELKKTFKERQARMQQELEFESKVAKKMGIVSKGKNGEEKVDAKLAEQWTKQNSAIGRLTKHKSPVKTGKGLLAMSPQKSKLETILEVSEIIDPAAMHLGGHNFHYFKPS